MIKLKKKIKSKYSKMVKKNTFKLYLYGECEVLADSESIVSLADTSAEGTAETEPNTTDKNEEKVLEISAEVTCPECHDENKDNNPTKESDIHLDTDVTGDQKVDIGRANSYVHTWRP